jgi:hypothetical protein
VLELLGKSPLLISGQTVIASLWRERRSSLRVVVRIHRILIPRTGELTLTTSVRETLCLTAHTISTVDIEVRSETAPSTESWLHTRLHEGWLEVRMLIGIERLVIRRKRHKLW